MEDRPRRKKRFSADGLATMCANLRKAHARMAAQGQTARQLAASQANLLKANADKTLKYRPTDRRLAASRANLVKARVLRKTRGSYSRSRYNRLKHGLFVGTVEETLRLLKEDPKEYQELHRLLARVFVPGDDQERAIVRRLRDTLWRRLRAYGIFLAVFTYDSFFRNAFEFQRRHAPSW